MEWGEEMHLLENTATQNLGLFHPHRNVRGVFLEYRLHGWGSIFHWVPNLYIDPSARMYVCMYILYIVNVGPITQHHNRNFHD